MENRTEGARGDTMPIHAELCKSDDDFAQASLFILEYKNDLHKSFTTLDMITLIYGYLTEGNLIKITDDEDRIVAIGAYFYGTPERQYEDKHEVAYVDNVIVARANRSTAVFVRGFQFLVSQILKDHPEVHEFRFAAHSENAYVQKLYSKFADVIGSQEEELGQKVIYSTQIGKIKAFLARFG